MVCHLLKFFFRQLAFRNVDYRANAPLCMAILVKNFSPNTEPAFLAIHQTNGAILIFQRAAACGIISTLIFIPQSLAVVWMQTGKKCINGYRGAVASRSAVSVCRSPAQDILLSVVIIDTDTGDISSHLQDFAAAPG